MHCDDPHQPRDAAVCASCGKPPFAVDPAPATPQPSLAQGERRQVTIWMADLCGYTGLNEVCDPEEVAEVMDRIERDGNSIRFRLTGPQLYDYTVEFTDSLSPPNWQALARYRAKLEPIDVVVTNSFTNAQARFFRVRQEFCNCRNE